MENCSTCIHDKPGASDYCRQCKHLFITEYQGDLKSLYESSVRKEVASITTVYVVKDLVTKEYFSGDVRGSYHEFGKLKYAKTFSSPNEYIEYLKSINHSEGEYLLTKVYDRELFIMPIIRVKDLQD